MSKQRQQKRIKGPKVKISPPSDAGASSTSNSFLFDYLLSIPIILQKAEKYINRKPSPASKRKNSAQIRRPMNKFMIYRQWANQEVKEYCKHAKLPSEQQKCFSTKAGASWHSLPPERRKPFEDKADEVKSLHEKLFPDYRFAPRTRGKNDANAKRQQSAQPESDAEPETRETDLTPETDPYNELLNERIVAEQMGVRVSPPKPIPPIMTIGADMGTSMGSAMDMRRSFGMGTSGGQEQVSPYYRSNYASSLPSNFASGSGSGAGPSKPSGHYRSHCNSYDMSVSAPTPASMQYLVPRTWDSLASTPGLSPSSSPARSPARSPAPRSASTGRSPARSAGSSSSPARYHPYTPATTPMPSMLSPEMHRIGRKAYKKVAREVSLNHIDNMYAQPHANDQSTIFEFDPSGITPVGGNVDGIFDPLQYALGLSPATDLTYQGLDEGLGFHVPTPEPRPVTPMYMPQDPASTQPLTEEEVDRYINYNYEG